MSNLSQFVSGSINPSCNITLNPLCVNSITICQFGQVIFFKDIQGENNLGCPFEGGHVICKQSNVSWIVSPRCAEVTRTWYDRDDAITVANLCTLCTGWFVPTCGQLRNPGYICRTYWDLFSSFRYWSSSESNFSAASAWNVCFTNGLPESSLSKLNSICVRAFRCVTY